MEKKSYAMVMAMCLKLSANLMMGMDGGAVLAAQIQLTGCLCQLRHTQCSKRIAEMTHRKYCLSGGCANLILKEGGEYCPVCEDYIGQIAELAQQVKDLKDIREMQQADVIVHLEEELAETIANESGGTKPRKPRKRRVR